MRSLPSGSWVCPAQNMSLGVGMSLKTSVFGSHSTERKLFASKFFWLFPEPATSSTLPVCSSAAWIVLIRCSEGMSRKSQWPLAALYSGWLILYSW